MAKILFLTWPERGHLNPSFKLAKSLKSRGHAVIYSQLYEFEEYICAEGLEFFPLFGKLFPKGHQFHQDPSVPLYEELSVILNELSIAQHKTAVDFLKEELGSIFERVSPQLLVMDSYLARSLMPARRQGDPPCILFSPTLMDPYDNVTFAAVSRMTTLFMCPEEFDLPGNEKLPQYRYVEASCDLLRKYKPWFQWGRIDEGKKLVYCSLGTQSLWSHEGSDLESKQHNIRNFLQAVVSAMAARTDWQLVVSLGSQLSAEDFHSVPANAVLDSEPPQLEILKKASLAITHGGLNTIKECILFGVPMLVFPVRGDQFGNAARVVFHGLGAAGNIKTASAGSIGSMMDKIERDPRFKSRAEAMRRMFLRLEREEPAVTIIEDCLAGRLPIPPVMQRSPQIVSALDALAARH
jgi:UDP:flavonoid glycosyltransferase YjiC (YdhE family)